MRYPTRKEFRLFTLVGIVLGVLGTLLALLRLPPPAPEIQNALDWNNYAAIAPNEFQLAYSWLAMPAYIAGVAGFLFFTRWSRKLLLYTLLLTFVADPFLGLKVALPLSSAILSLGGFIFGFPFVLSFFPPCNSYFGKQPEVPTNPDWSSVNVIEEVPGKSN